MLNRDIALLTNKIRWNCMNENIKQLLISKKFNCSLKYWMSIWNKVFKLKNYL